MVLKRLVKKTNKQAKHKTKNKKKRNFCLKNMRETMFIFQITNQKIPEEHDLILNLRKNLFKFGGIEIFFAFLTTLINTEKKPICMDLL